VNFEDQKESVGASMVKKSASFSCFCSVFDANYKNVSYVSEYYSIAWTALRGWNPKL
jgi:hypothetical protein